MTTSKDGAATARPERRSSIQPNLNSKDPYAVLGLLRGATEREVKRAYFELVRAYPPEEQPDAFKLIRAAYEKLRTGGAKAETDLFLFQPPPAWEPRRRRPKLNLDFRPDDLRPLLQNHGDLGRADHAADFRPVRL
jgi:curved DNA-binding protein CbpA